MEKTERMAIVLRTDAGVDELEAVKFGSPIECKAYMFDELAPSDFTRNVKKLESNDGYLYSVEKKANYSVDVDGNSVGGDWKEYKYLLLYTH